MAIIQSGASADQWTIDPTSKAGRGTLYDASGNVLIGSKTIANSIPVNIASDQLPFAFSNRISSSSGIYGCGSFRVPGTATTNPLNLATITNNAGAKTIYLRRISVDLSTSAAATDLVSGSFRIWPNTGVTPSGGTAPTKQKYDSAYATSQAATQILFGASADGTSTAITHALPGSTPLRETFRDSVMTAVGVQGSRTDFVLLGWDSPPIAVRSGETTLVAMVPTNGADVATRMYIVMLVWEEF